VSDFAREILGLSLDVAVTIEIDRMRRLALDEVLDIARASSDVVAAHGDDLQFGGKHCRETFVALARGLAAASFVPGGIRFLGRRWESQHPERAS
jgi:hypothetical protein